MNIRKISFEAVRGSTVRDACDLPSATGSGFRRAAGAGSSPRTGSTTSVFVFPGRCRKTVAYLLHLYLLGSGAKPQ